MTSAGRWSVCAVMLVCACVAGAQAPNPRTAGATIQGKVRPIVQELLLLGSTHASSRQAVTRTMHALLEIVHRNPAFSPPVGLDIAPTLLARTPVVGPNRHVVQYEVDEGLHWYTIVRGGQTLPEFVSSRAFHLHANHIAAVFNETEAWVEDATKQTFWEPRQAGTEGGHPIYDTGNTHKIVIKKNERPLWVALTRQQVLAQMLANARKAHADLPRDVPAGVREAAQREVACLDAALAGLSAAEQLQPAYVTPFPPRASACSPLVDATVAQARRLVTENPAFYDKGRAASDIQMIVLIIPSFPPQAWQHGVVEKLRKGMDYSALADQITSR